MAIERRRHANDESSRLDTEGQPLAPHAIWQELVRRSHYGTLSIPHDATHATIRRAFRAGALRHHPDHNPGDDGASGRFRALYEAFATLGVVELRAAYDRRLRSDFDTRVEMLLTEGFGGAGGPAAGNGARPAREEVREEKTFGYERDRDDDEPEEEDEEEFDLALDREELLDRLGIVYSEVVGERRDEVVHCMQCAVQIEDGATAHYSDDDGCAYCSGCCDGRLRRSYGG